MPLWDTQDRYRAKTALAPQPVSYQKDDVARRCRQSRQIGNHMRTVVRLEAKSLLLVTLFFSTSNGCNDPSRVIITLAYQIASQRLLYRDFIREKVANNPRPPQKPITTDFTELIVEPFAKKLIYRDDWPVQIYAMISMNARVSENNAYIPHHHVSDDSSSLGYFQSS